MQNAMQKIGVVFVSRRNSLRSVLAEACLLHLSQRFSVRSCGRPGEIARSVHPAALGALGSASIPLPPTALRSWDEFTRSGAPRADLVITLDASIEPLQPRWPGQPDAALWPYPDVAAIDNAEEAAHAAIQTLFSLRRRLELLVNLPLHGLDRAAVRADVRDLAHLN